MSKRSLSSSVKNKDSSKNLIKDEKFSRRGSGIGIFILYLTNNKTNRKQFRSQ